MKFKQMFGVLFFSTVATVYSMQKDQSCASPEMKAYLQHYYKEVLPKAAFGENKNEIVVPQQNKQNLKPMSVEAVRAYFRDSFNKDKTPKNIDVGHSKL